MFQLKRKFYEDLEDFNSDGYKDILLHLSYKTKDQLNIPNYHMNMPLHVVHLKLRNAIWFEWVYYIYLMLIYFIIIKIRRSRNSK